MTVKSAGGRDQGSGSRGQVLRLAPHYYFSGGRPLVNYRRLQMRRPGGHMCRR